MQIRQENVQNAERQFTFFKENIAGGANIWLDFINLFL